MTKSRCMEGAHCLLVFEVHMEPSVGPTLDYYAEPFSTITAAFTLYRRAHMLCWFTPSIIPESGINMGRAVLRLLSYVGKESEDSREGTRNRLMGLHIQESYKNNQLKDIYTRYLNDKKRKYIN